MEPGRTERKIGTLRCLIQSPLYTTALLLHCGWAYLSPLWTAAAGLHTTNLPIGLTQKGGYTANGHDAAAAQPGE